MNASKNTVKNVTTQILAAETDHRRSVRSAGIGEQRNDAFRCKLDRDRNKHAKACGEHHRIAQRLNGPLRFARTDILRSQGRNGRQHRRGDQKEETDHFLHNPDRRCVIQSTLIGNNRDNNKSNLNQAVLKRNRDADPQNFPHDRTARLEVAFFQNDAPAFQNNGKGNNYTDCLRESCTKGCARRPKVQHTHKKIV